MDKNDRIFVAGSNGLVGSALVRRLKAGGYSNLLLPEIDELDLTNPVAVADFFARERPEYVLLAAAKVRNLNAGGPVTLAQYNPPWTPWFMRRNEIWLELE